MSSAADYGLKASSSPDGIQTVPHAGTRLERADTRTPTGAPTACAPNDAAELPPDDSEQSVHAAPTEDEAALRDAYEAATHDDLHEEASAGRLILRDSTAKEILARVPALSDGAFRRLLAHSLVGQMIHTSVDRAGRRYNRVMIPCWLLAEFQVLSRGFELRSRETNRRKYPGKPFLEAYRRIFPSFWWTLWGIGEYTRQIGADGLPDDLRALILEDLSLPVGDAGPLVDFATLSPVSDPSSGRASGSAKAKRASLLRRANRQMAQSPWELQRLLMTHLNSVPTNTLSGIVRRNMTAAIATALDTEDPCKRLRTLAALREIPFNPGVVYAPSRRLRSPRVYSTSVSPLGLHKTVREALLAGCVDLDLANSQLALAAGLWDIRPLLDHLQHEGSIWPRLRAAVAGTHGLSAAEAKAALKDALYGAMYGMTRQGLKHLLTSTVSADAAAAFLSDALVVALLKARDVALSDLNAAGEITDCLGRRRVLQAPLKSRARAAECRSALAGSMQAFELRMLEPVIDEAIREAARKQPAWRIVAWLHDGLTISVRGHPARTVRRLMRLVAEQAKRLGVPTRLEATWLGSSEDPRELPAPSGGGSLRRKARHQKSVSDEVVLDRASDGGTERVAGEPNRVLLEQIRGSTVLGGPEGDCWIWTGPQDRDGYGLKRFGRPKNARVHRVSWEVANGRPVPQGLVVRHTCHTPACVNPDHLVTGTQQENIADRDAAGRTARGEQNGRSALTDAIVREARRLAEGGEQFSRIARRFGVDPSTARAAIRGRTWAHVKEVPAL